MRDERGLGATTYKGFQAAEQLRDSIKTARAKKFVFSKTSTDGEVPQPQQLDVWMVRIVTLKESNLSSACVGANSVVDSRPMKQMM